MSSHFWDHGIRLTSRCPVPGTNGIQGSGVTPICSMIRSNCRTSVAASKRLKQHRCKMLKVTWKATRPTWRG